MSSVRQIHLLLHRHRPEFINRKNTFQQQVDSREQQHCEQLGQLGRKMQLQQGRKGTKVRELIGVAMREGDWSRLGVEDVVHGNRESRSKPGSLRPFTNGLVITSYPACPQRTITLN